MAIGVGDRKHLWARSSDQCAFPDCTQVLTDIPRPGTPDNADDVIGQEAHIRSKKVDGPRHDGSYASEKLDSYENLLLLCPTHHRFIDKDNGQAYSVEQLVEMRQNHETAMRATRSRTDEKLLLLAEHVTSSVQMWEEKMMIARWESLTWDLNSGTPSIFENFRSAMFNTRDWLLVKDWPADFPKVHEAFAHFTYVLDAVVAHIRQTFRRDADEVWRVERKHKQYWDSLQYENWMYEFRLRSMYMWCLTIELTRAANLVVRAVREDLDPFYRFDEGVLVASDGDGLNMRKVRHEYAGHVWGEPLPKIANTDWETTLAAEAARCKIDPDQLDPFRMISILTKDA